MRLREIWVANTWLRQQWTDRRLRWKHRNFARLAATDLRLFSRGLLLLERVQLTEEWQIAMTIVAAQAARCLSAAWTLLFLEYDTQPLALARLAGEYTLLLQYLDTHHDQAGAWIDPGARTPMTVGEIAQQLEREGTETYPKSVRDLLHRFSHQDTLAIGMSVRVKDMREDSGVWTLHVGDPSEHFRTIAGNLVVQNALLLVRLHDFLSGLDARWDRDVARQTTRHLTAIHAFVADSEGEADHSELED
jgi:hypothetical protein